MRALVFLVAAVGIVGYVVVRAQGQGNKPLVQEATLPGFL
ncbi:MAG: hypothetical protein CM1200mP36_10950 [Gammaproteobacteria bacterium]|nr:MAG: hypothetical protein CM1200mP36_10950 [Gammaproteobacteria bacterium]